MYLDANAIDDLRNEIRYISISSALEYYAYNELGESDVARSSANRYREFVENLFSSKEDLYRLDGLDKFKGNYWSNYFPEEIGKVLNYITQGEYSILSIDKTIPKKFREQQVNWAVNTLRGILAACTAFAAAKANEEDKDNN